MILFSQVTKRVNKELVLKDINFIIKRNDFVFVYEKDQEIMRTLLLLLSGQLKADKGLIRINNSKKLKPELYKDIGIVYFDEFFLSKRNIFENLNFVLQLCGRKKSYPELRIKKVLDIVEINEYKYCLPKELMAHQYIRASIARSLLLYPSILILEDPLKFLDDVNSQAIFHLLKKINKLNVTIVFICSDKQYINRNNSEKLIALKADSEKLKKEGYHV